jgi:ABC-2 type transport system permease protein
VSAAAGAIGTELAKQLRRPRSWATLAVMGAVAALLTLVIGSTRPAIAERVGDWSSVVTDTSGFTMPLIALSAMVLFLLPLAVSIFAGEPVAGEAAWGSLRYLLARPVPRWRVLAAKATVAAGFSLAAVAVVVAVATLSGLMAFGWHPLTVVDLRDTTAFNLVATTFSPGAAIGRVALASVLVVCSLASTFAAALLLSTLTTRPFSAVAGGIGLGIASRALDNIPGLHALGPWLPVTDSSTTWWTGALSAPMQLGGMGHQLAVQALYTGPLLVAAFARFARADILS